MWSLQQPTQQELLYLVEVTLVTQVSTDPFVYRQSTVTPRFTTSLHCRHSAVFNDVLRPHHPVIFESFVNREVQLRAVVFDCA